MVLNYYILDNNGHILDNKSCSWIISFNHPNTISGLIDFCNNQIQDCNYQMSLLENSDITIPKTNIINKLNNCSTITHLNDILDNESRIIKCQLEMTEYEINSYLELMKKIDDFKIFLEKYREYKGEFSN